MTKPCHGCGTPVEQTPRAREKKWCSEGCRKRSLYSGTCIDCGARTGYSGHGTDASERCTACAGARATVWTRGGIVNAIRAFAAHEGRQPSALEWQRSRPSTYPATATVLNVFGSWNAAIRAAGFEPQAARGGPPGSTPREEYERTAQMYRDGMTYEEIAAACGITVRGVDYRLQYVNEPRTRVRAA